MNFIKSLIIACARKSKVYCRGQNLIEYSLLVSIAIITLIAAHFVINVKNHGFAGHFQEVKTYIKGGSLDQ